MSKVEGEVTGRTFGADRNAPYTPPPLRPAQLARWAWRQLTSMRVALVLLFLLAVLAIPGSLLPQRRINPVAVDAWIADHPSLGPFYDRLSLFDVYSSPWFSSVYLLLFVSLVGCILPRSLAHYRAMRARPPKAPRNLSRLPAHRSLTVDASADEALDAARAVLRSRRYRVDVHPSSDGGGGSDGGGSDGGGSDGGGSDGGGGSVAAEKGHLRETGNLVFHMALVLVLASVALGGLTGYRAQVLVPQGEGFANSAIQYDSLEAGPRFDPTSLPPFSLTVDEFRLRFRDSGPQRGAAEDFAADVTVIDQPGAESRTQTIRVNHPMTVDGTQVHILNPGYAPRITVRDAEGETRFSGPVPFLPQDDNFGSTGVVKVQVPGGDDIGLQGLFLPSAALDPTLGPISVFPAAANPALYFTAWSGDLGLDEGQTQSVYRLDTSQMTQFTEGGEPYRRVLAVGESVALPDGATVTLDGYVPWVNFQISKNVGKDWALVGAIGAIVGLLGSLFVRRRRAWVRVVAGVDGRSVVEVAGLDRQEGGDLSAEVDEITDDLRRRLGAEPAPTAVEDHKQGES